MSAEGQQAGAPGPLDAVRGLGTAVGSTALRPAVGLARIAGAAARRAVHDVTLMVVDVALDSRTADAVVDRIVESRLLEDAVAKVVDSPAFDEAVRRVLAGDLLDAVVAELLKRDELWVMVDEIAHSPTVTEAIASQSVGFVDQVAGGVRDRSRKADDALARVARRVLLRRTARQLAPPPPSGPQPT
jgi:hypothetical protein